MALALAAAPGVHAVIDARYCVQQPTVLVLKEKFFSWTGDSATIKDQTGTVWFKVNPKFFSLRDKRVVEDAYGQAAFSLKSKLLSLHSTWEMYKGDSYDKAHKVCDIKQSMMASMAPELGKLMGGSIKVYFNDGDKECDYYAEGNFMAKQFSVYKVVPGAGKTNDILVAKIQKESRFSSIKNFLLQSEFDAQTYFLELQPGADAAFLTALAIVVDENLRDGNN